MLTVGVNVPKPLRFPMKRKADDEATRDAVRKHNKFAAALAASRGSSIAPLVPDRPPALRRELNGLLPATSTAQPLNAEASEPASGGARSSDGRGEASELCGHSWGEQYAPPATRLLCQRARVHLPRELCTSPGCRHLPGVCALTCACCGGECINGKPAVQCPTCELFFCDVECHRRTPCPHDGSLCMDFEQTKNGLPWDPEEQDDHAAAGFGCQCMCCRSRLPPCCWACGSSPCRCAQKGFALNGTDFWKTRYAPWIEFHQCLEVEDSGPESLPSTQSAPACVT